MAESGLVLEGRYRLDVLLGAGGMGEVWEGTDLRLGRRVAVKVLLDSWARQPEAQARFLREGRAAAGLDHHPAIAAVHDVGEDGGRPFLVMELLRGESFQALLARSPDGVPVHEVISCGVQIADGLAVAHAAGVVHRDIKPANLMLLPGARVKVCDFGIARVETASARLTLTGDAVGTAAYMAPEQWQGLPVDGRADLYSLGCVLYEMAAGRAAFRPGPRPALEPAALDALLVSMLATDPGQRPATAAIVAATLRGIADRRQQATAAARIRTLRLLDDAEHIALTLSSPLRLALFCEIARVAVTPDPDLARRLLAEAEILASTYADPWYEYEQILEVMAGVDLAEAERILQAFTEPDNRDRQVRKLIGLAVARAAAERNADTAKQVLADAARIARAVADRRASGWRLQEIAKAAAMRDPDAAVQLLAEAEQIALALADSPARSEDLRIIAQAMMAVNAAEAGRILADAEQVARSLTQTPEQATHILRIAEAAIGFDNGLTRRLVTEVERVASAFSDRRLREPLLEQTAEAIARLDLAEAGRIATAMEDQDRRGFILWWMARDGAAQDPPGALHLLAEAARLGQAAGDSCRLKDVTAVMAGIDPRLAEQTARTIPDQDQRCRALLKIAEAVGGQEPQRARRLLAEAEQLSSSIRNGERAEVLSQIARLLVPFDTEQARRVLADAERAARGIPAWFSDRSDTEGTAIEVAKALAATAPAEAERIARGLHHQDNAILEVAKIISIKDADAAIRVVQAISDRGRQMQALADLAACVAERDLPAAERIAGKVSEPEYHARALMQMAEAAILHDPGWN